ncbi:FAD-binding protein [Arenibaculum pallidiluteum]|uniref:FAD-binding protein n=1 Tax=Arenibaculum pallidiluteum TaxID=2812559 RepID=UPI001A961187|nr:FAD-binding protein [Arenibaculum pallidiluteum]
MNPTEIPAAGIPWSEAIAALDGGSAPPPAITDAQPLLRHWHPDHSAGGPRRLAVGASAGQDCPAALADLLQADALIDDIDIAGCATVSTEVLVIGGGGAGCIAALTAAEAGAKVLLTTKLGLGDSNTVMAEGGIQCAVGAEDSLQTHFEDTLRGGQMAGDRALVAALVGDGPASVRWLIERGMTFDMEEGQGPSGRLRRKRAGGTRVPRILSFRDVTGLEMMRVLREAAGLHPRITVWNRSPVVELLSDETGGCVGAVIYSLHLHRFVLIRARSVVMATGGAGRLHLNGFPTSNHLGATADGLVLAYRMGARLREPDSFQYHPTGIAWPPALRGQLISEAARSLGATLVNGHGHRFVDELSPRDVVAAAILRECGEGRGVLRDGCVGVLLDTPALERARPGILKTTLVTLCHLAHKAGIDPAREPVPVYPTLHYQNGGIAIGTDGGTEVPGLYCAGEVSGGIHGRNRLMGNALLELVGFGRRAGAAAAAFQPVRPSGRANLGHVQEWRRALVAAGLPLDVKAPVLFPPIAGFDLAADRALGRSDLSARSLEAALQVL